MLIRKLIRGAVQEEIRALHPAHAPRSVAADESCAKNDAPMTTVQAAHYCGFKTTSSLRKALMEGRLAPIGRRGGKGTYMWSRSALDGFLAGGPSAIVPGG